MASDRIIEILELMKEGKDDPARLAEFYSAVANSELVLPMILNSGQKAPIPVMFHKHTEKTVVFDPVNNDYVARRPGVGGEPYCLVYSSHEVYESIKQILESRTQRFGQIVDHVAKNGRQIINMCCKRKQRAAINLFAYEAFQYQLTFELMEIIQRTPLIAKPKAAP